MDSVSAGKLAEAPNRASRLAKRIAKRFAAAFVVATLAGAAVTGAAHADHPFPNCPDGQLPFYGHFPIPSGVPGQFELVEVSACFPVPTPGPVGPGTPSAGGGSASLVEFTTPTPIAATATRVPTQTPVVITVIATASAPQATTVPQTQSGIRPPNTGDAGLSGSGGPSAATYAFLALTGGLAIGAALRQRARATADSGPRAG